MKITKSKLKQIIKEELENILNPQTSDESITWSDRNAWGDAKAQARNTYSTQDIQALQVAVGNSYNIIDPFDRGALQHVSSGGGDEKTIIPLGTYLTSDDMGTRRLIWFKTTNLGSPSYGYVSV